FTVFSWLELAFLDARQRAEEFFKLFGRSAARQTDRSVPLRLWAGAASANSADEMCARIGQADDRGQRVVGLVRLMVVRDGVGHDLGQTPRSHQRCTDRAMMESNHLCFSLPHG